MQRTQENGRWLALLVLTALSVVFYIFMEWLFFVTKPSFLTPLPFLKRAVVVVMTVFLSLLTGCAVVAVCCGMSRLFRNSVYQSAWMGFARLPGSLILASATLLLLDNFTITIFHFGIPSSEGTLRFLYCAVFLTLFFLSFRWIGIQQHRLASRIPERASAQVLILCSAFIVLQSVLLILVPQATSKEVAQRIPSETLPNILLIGGDGINADKMSVYGYGRNTTPFLAAFANKALLCENAFSNASKSLGSLISLLTGKLPTQTKLICAPDILRGVDAYQHLPGILKKYGYRSIQWSARSYADAFDANMRSGFDVVNGRESAEQKVLARAGSLFSIDTSYFLQALFDRISERLLHVFGIRQAPDPFGQITHKKLEKYPDGFKLRELLNFMKSQDRPFFAHIHFMETHKFSMAQFTRAMDPEGGNKKEIAYEQAIRRFDQRVQTIIESLERQGSLEKTIIIVYSDHGANHSTKRKVPLIFRFPRGRHAGKIVDNVQSIDVAPTLLDYLQIPIPEWMAGRSLLAVTHHPCRPVLIALPSRLVDQVQKLKIRASAKAPFYTLGSVAMIVCNEYYRLDLEKESLQKEAIPNYTGDCMRCPQPNAEEAVWILKNHLQKSNYEIGP